MLHFGTQYFGTFQLSLPATRSTSILSDGNASEHDSYVELDDVTNGKVGITGE